MGKRVQVLECYDGQVKVKYEGEVIRFMTHLEGQNGCIYSHEMALIQLDNGRFVTARIGYIRLKK